MNHNAVVLGGNRHALVLAVLFMSRLHRLARVAQDWWTPARAVRDAGNSTNGPRYRLTGGVMVVTGEQDTREQLAEAMRHCRESIATITRRGHDGRHKSCDDCERYDALHAMVNSFLTCYERAPE